MLIRRWSLQKASQFLKNGARSTKRLNLSHFRTLSSGRDEINVLKSPYKDIVLPNLTIPEYLWQNLHKWENKTAVVCGVTGRGYTFSQAFRLSNAFAANLRNKLRLQNGDHVAVMMPNLPEYPLAALGVMTAGGALSTINPIYTPHEIQRQLVLSEAKIVITTADKTEVIREALKLANLDLPIIVVKTKTEESTPPRTILFSELAEDTHANLDSLKEVRRNTDDLAILPYSSGTTGLPKGVELEHRNIIANCEQVDDPLIKIQEDTTETHQDAVMAVLPFFHIYGMVVVMLQKLSRGCKLVVMPGFQPDTYLNAMIKQKVSAVFAAPPLVLFMATHPEIGPQHYEHLRIIVSGAAPLPVADINRLFQKAQKEFYFVEGYGLTETSPVVCESRRGEKAYGTVGYPLPSTDVKMVDANGNALGPDEPGEMLVRGPQVMRGYRNNAEANAQIFAPGRWMRTGDLASYNAKGQITIRGRFKELIKVKGYQVPPAELEALLREHPEVADAAVVGAPHATSGEVPRAFVVVRGSQQVSAEALKQYVAEKVAPYKKIVHLQFIEAIPKNASGKILRKELENMKLP